MQNINGYDIHFVMHCVNYILLVCYLSLKESTCETREKIILFQKHFLFSRKSNFRILDIQPSWYNQMPQHKTKTLFYRIILEVTTVC